MKEIGKRISFVNKKDLLTVVISGKVERWKETALVMWYLAWNLVGATFIYQTFQMEIPNQRLFMFVVLAFWAYFEVKIGRATFWRIKGKELVIIDEDTIGIKDSIFGFGKQKKYFIENIEDVQIVPEQTKNFLYNMENSFWTIGTGKIKLVMQGGQEKSFAYQLDAQDTNVLYRLISSTLLGRKGDLKRKQKKEAKKSEMQ